jgi:prophage regulatory protein
MNQANKRPATNLDLRALVLRKRAVCAMLAISLAHLDRLRRSGDFPTPVRLGEQAIGWTLASVENWLANRPLVTQ